MSRTEKESHKEKKTRQKKTVLIISAAILAALVLAGSVCAFAVWRTVYTPLEAAASDTQRFEVGEGSSARRVARELQEAGLIKSAAFFYYYARFTHLVVRSGVYELSPSMSIRDMAQKLAEGSTESVRFIVPEGLTLKKMAARLESFGVTAAEDFIAAAENSELLASYHIPASSFEGYLFPDTYFLEPSMEGEAVVRMMADNFFSKIADIPQSQGLDPQSLHNTIILASIVEREYRLQEEAPLIASAFENRLRDHIGLYSCATVEYIITEIHGLPHPDIITYADLADPSPYNTYRWAGLPPGPISNPGLVSLKAAFNPPETGYYYFRLVDPQTGRHHFSETFDEHTAIGETLYTKKAAGG